MTCLPRCLRARPSARGVLCLVLACIAPAAAAAGGGALGFDDALRLAAQHAPQLRAQQSRSIAAREELASADALPDPRLVAGIQNLPIGGSDAFTLGADRMTMRRIGLAQELPSRAKRHARAAAAAAAVTAADAEALAAQLAVQRAAAQAWVALWAAQREQALVAALQEQSALAVRAARARLSGGGGSASDVLAVRTAELELANRLDAAAIRVAEARAALARWIGTAPAALAAERPDFAELGVDEAVLLAELESTGELLVWGSREAAAEARLQLAQAEKRPDMALSGGYAQRGAGGSDVVWLEMSVDLPLFTRNRQDRGVAARLAERDAVLAERQDALRAQAARIAALFAEWRGLGEQARRFEAEILPLLDDRARIALAAYSGGSALQPWIEARRDELAARVEYARTLAAWGDAWATLESLLPAEVLR